MAITVPVQKLRRALYLGLCLLTSCNVNAPVETTVEAYWSALGRGDVAAAYTYLSDADKVYLDEQTYRRYLFAQPSMRFLLLSLSEEPTPPKKRWGKEADGGVESVPLELIATEVKGSHAHVQVTVQLPDLRDLLGEDLTQTQVPSEEKVRAETRLLRNLARPAKHLPQARYSHVHTLVKEKGKWRVEVAHYRVRAMLAQAKDLSANRDLEGAHNLLQALSELPAAAQLNLSQPARRGRRMLPYLHRLEFTDFKRFDSASCPAAANVQVANTGEFPVETLDAVIEFSGSKEVLARQKVTLGNPDSLIHSGAQTPFELCLKPPKNWTGEAIMWASWLEFPEEIYKQQIR